MERQTPTPGATGSAAIGAAGPGPVRTGLTVPGGIGAGWPAQVADRIDSTVGLVRDRTVRPATLVAKALVYGPIVAIVGILVAVMVAVAAVRALNIVLDDWISLLAVGGFFTLIGLLLVSRGRSALRSRPPR